MNAIIDACKFTIASPIALVSHECKQVVIQFLIEFLKQISALEC